MTNYYVAKNGNDNNIGSETLPFLTIQKGVNEAIAGDTVYVKAGTYIEEVNSPNSGTDGKYITFQNYATDVVTLKPPIKSYHTFDSVTPNHHPGNWEILNKSYIRITGFVFGGYNITTQIPYSVITIAYGSHHIIIDNNRFDDFDADAAAVIGQTPITSDQKTGAWNGFRIPGFPAA